MPNQLFFAGHRDGATVPTSMSMDVDVDVHGALCAKIRRFRNAPKIPLILIRNAVVLTVTLLVTA